MYSTRSSNTPVDLVVAETLAYPLASESAFHNVLLSLDPHLAGRTGNVWRDFERASREWNSISLEELAYIRDAHWFSVSHTHATSLGEFLRRLATAYLSGTEFTDDATSHRGARYYGDVGVLGHDARRRWRWLTTSLPSDLIVAGCDAGHHSAPEMISPFVDRLLMDKGFAEVHLHLKAAFTFDRLWVSTVYSLADKAMRAETMYSPGAGFKDGREMTLWLLRAAIARVLLSHFLVSRDATESFSQYWKRICKTLGNRHGHTLSSALNRGLAELMQGSLQSRSPSLAVLRHAYSLLLASSGRTVPSLPDFFEMDPVARFVGFRQLQTGTPEFLLIRACLKYMEQRAGDADFSKIFWQATRVRNLFFRHVTQRPALSGLQWFLRVYKRLKHHRALLTSDICTESAFEVCGAGAGLRSLEVRVSPEESHHQMRSTLKRIKTSAERSSRRFANIEFGVVVHFQKTRYPKTEETDAAFGSHTEGDPSIHSTFRFGNYYKSQMDAANAVLRAVEGDEELVSLIRGFDVCADELAIPNWAVLGGFRKVQYGINNLLRMARRDGVASPKRCHSTIHVGEEFVHLVTGLRNIEESIRWFDLGEGDRLGHAIALGVDPVSWCERTNRVALPREEYVLNLLWEWRAYSQFGVTFPSHRGAWLECELRKQAELMFGLPVSPKDLDALVYSLTNSSCLLAIGYPHRRTTYDGPLKGGLLWRYLTHQQVFRRGREIVWIDTSNEGPLLADLQSWVKSIVGQRCLTIEINPSSNNIVGDFGDFSRHPFWRLAMQREPKGPKLPVCIGSDDPITFSTNLRSEYQIVYDGLVTGGVAEEDARSCLDWMRQCGLNARFTGR